MDLEPVIGLEVHAQVNTETKIFCGCSTKFGADANTQTCPVCLGLPGVLPVLNGTVLRKAVLSGLALNCEISKYSKFDRKNYFYPDLPKAYQISQFDKPICLDGYVEIQKENEIKKIGLIRIHMEEDAGKSIHEENESLVDLNRTGVPLLEIVSKPEIFSSQDAYDYLQSLKSILKYINVSDCNMEEGSLRCDVNISLKEKNVQQLGVKVEIKNLNSFKAVKASIDYEIKRQGGLIESGEKIIQETRLWDAERNQTYSMRSKEEAHDYRYFPDPDLPPVIISDALIAEIRSALPELPAQRCKRFIEQYQLTAYDSAVLTSVKELAEYFESAAAGVDAKKTANWVLNELLAHVDDPEKIQSFVVTPDNLCALIKLIDSNVISGKIAKTVFDEMLKSNEHPESIVDKKGLKQITDSSAIESIVDKVILNNPESVKSYKEGKEKALKSLVGQVMKETAGKANPAIVNEILLKKLSQ